MDTVIYLAYRLGILPLGHTALPANVCENTHKPMAHISLLMLANSG